MAPKLDDLAVVHNVVVVEDDPLTRLAIELVFVDDPRFRICWHAGSLSRALERAAEETREIDLVVLDDVLDGRPSGAELAPLLKHLWPAARVVLFSADTAAWALPPDVDDAVPKTEPELLLARSRAVLGLTTPAPAVHRRSPAPFAARRSRPRRAALPVGVRLAALAAAVLAVVSSAGVSAPRRLVTEVVGFVGRLVPAGQPDAVPPAGGARRGPAATPAPPAPPASAAPAAPAPVPAGAPDVPPPNGVPARPGARPDQRPTTGERGAPPERREERPAPPERREERPDRPADTRPSPAPDRTRPDAPAPEERERPGATAPAAPAPAPSGGERGDDAGARPVAPGEAPASPPRGPRA